MAETYRAFVGAIQFDPRDGKAGGKDVRNIVIRATGGGDQAIRVAATVWPSHEHIELEKGDVVFIEGKFTRNTSTKEDGEKVVYNNLSVSTLAKLGSGDAGRKESQVENPVDEVADDDIPF